MALPTSRPATAATVADIHFTWRKLLCCLALIGPLVVAVRPVHAADIPWVWYSSDAPDQAAEVAVLTETLYFSGTDIDIRHRRRSLIVPETTQVTPTVHVHLDLAKPVTLGTGHAAAIVEAVTSAARLSTSHWVQLDFEALDAQQEFYVGVVDSLRKRLPRTIRLSVTVQARLCAKPGLLDRLAADEVVPMFFRMGEAANDFRERLISNPPHVARRCLEQAAGFALQEPMPAAVTARYQRRYWFNYKNWQ